MNVAESFSRLEGFADYPHFKTLLSGIRQTLIQVKEPQLGDVLLFNPAGGVAHVGFLSAPNMLIHADRVRKFVVEQRLPVRYHSAFKLPSIVDG
jgi:cell wall-associated NlpC family hydrolase